MRPLRLVMEGLRSYRQRQEVSFEGLGLFAITGRTGAGKSSLLEALVFALYHATTFDKRSVTSLISDGAEDLTVCLEFQVLGQRWQVTRSISRANRQAVHELRGLDSGERLDRKTEVDERIVALLGLTCDDFLKTVVLPQGQFQALLQSSPADRAPLLKNLLGLDQLDRLAEQVAGRREQLALAVQQGQGRRQSLPERPQEEAAQARVRLQELSSQEERLALQVQQVELLERESQRRERDALLQRRQLGALAELPLPRPEELDRLERIERGLRAEAEALEAELERRGQELAELEGQGWPELGRWREEWRRQRMASVQLERDREEYLRGQESFRAEQAELKALLAAAREATEAQQALQEQGAALAAGLEQARAALAVLRQELSQAALQAETRSRRLRVMQDLREELTALEEHLPEREREAEQAALALRESERANLVAALCAEHAGPGCPVCERPLPKRWQAPEGGDLAGARSLAQSALGALRELAGKVEQARGGLAAVTVELEDLPAEPCAVEEPGLAQREAEVAALELQHRQLQENWLLKHRESERLRATAAEKARHLERGQRDRERLEQQVHATAAGLAEDAASLAQALELPSLEGAEARLAELEERAQELARQREAARQGVVEAHRRQAALSARRHEELERPRRAVQTQLTTLAATLEGDREVLDLEDLGAAVRRLAVRRQAAGERLSRDLAARLREQAAHIARLAALLPEGSSGELRGRWVQAREERALQARALELCEQAQAQAEKLDEVLEPARRLSRQLEFLHEALGNRRGKGRLSFSQWLLEQRQQELLVLASRNFGRMSCGQYGFSAQFQVVDRGSGQARKPNTLSGGESFLASLSLALALSELVGRRGGRLEAFFLDEGFGSLSPEALDRALDALEELATSGRMIGVISHVALVAERIEKVWHVQRTPEGSRLEALQAHQRVRLAREEVYDSAEHPLLAAMA